MLLSLCVDQRAKRRGLYGRGVSLKITYADMKGITRSHSLEYCDSAETIYREAKQMLAQVKRAPVRLIGVSVYNLTGEIWKQLSFEDILEEGSAGQPGLIENGLAAMQERYHLDFAGHLEQIYHSATLYRTIEYMRKHFVLGTV